MIDDERAGALARAALLHHLRRPGGIFGTEAATAIITVAGDPARAVLTRLAHEYRALA
jgi:hypothetical protein